MSGPHTQLPAPAPPPHAVPLPPWPQRPPEPPLPPRPRGPRPWGAILGGVAVAVLLAVTVAVAAVSLASPADEDAGSPPTTVDDSALPSYTPDLGDGDTAPVDPGGSAGQPGTPGAEVAEGWDPAIADLVAWVEEFRGLEFERAVPVRFLTTEEFSDEALTGAPTAAELDADVAHLRGFGLLPAQADLAAAAADLADIGTLAYYDTWADEIVVRGTEMTPAVQGTVVHELTHALHAQHFDLAPAGDPEADMALLAVEEGDAMRVESEWSFTLDEAEVTAYRDEIAAGYQDYVDAAADVPPIIEARDSGPYTLGPQLVDVLAAEGGNEAVDAALAAPPRSTEQALDPGAFLAPDEPITVEAPALPPTASEAGDPMTLGAYELYLVLATRVGPVQALDAVDGWAGDSTVTYRQGPRACVAVAVQGDSGSDAEQLRAALDAWVAAGPAEAARVAPGPGDATTLRSCEPAPGTDPAAGSAERTDPRAAVMLLDSRALFTWEAMEFEGAAFEDAMARSDCLVRTLPLDTLTALLEDADPPDAVREALDGAKAGCAPD